MDAPPASPLRRAAKASLWIALALTAWTTYLIVESPGARFVIFVVILIPPMFAAYYAAAFPPSWLACKVLDVSRWRAVTGLAIASIAAAGLVAPFFIFSLFVPNYLRPAYRGEGIELAPAADFVAPWGGRMIALQIPAHELLKRPAQMLWVAETELTRGEYARLMDKQVEGDPQFPMTALSREQVEDVLKAMNKAVVGRYRLPTLTQMHLYSGDWWINRYPKSLFRCQSSLEAAGARPANGLGLRGTVDNAAELVFDQELLQGYCATVGGVEPHCGRRFTEEGASRKSAGISVCEPRDRRDADKVWKHPGVGVRVVFVRD